MELSYLIPTVATLLLGGYLYTQGQSSLGDVTAATLYVQMLIDPVDRIVSILDELQLGAASLARLLGRGRGARRPEVTGHRPTGEELTAEDVRFSYVEGATCCTASTSRSAWVNGSRWSGPRERASRRWAGCSPGSTRPAPER